LGNKRKRLWKHVLFHLAGMGMILGAVAGCNHPEGLWHVDGNTQTPVDRGEVNQIRMCRFYTDPENPDRNVDMGRQCYENILAANPESPFAGEARFVLRLVDELGDRENALRKLQTERENDARAIVDARKALTELQKQNTALSNQVKTLADQIEGMKAVDIGIEEMKREVLSP